MQLVCPECSTSYKIADGAIGAGGRTVKCARCGHGWHQDPEPEAVEAAEAAEAPAAETPAEVAEAEPEPVEEEPAPDVEADDVEESAPVDVAEEGEPASEEADDAGEEPEEAGEAAEEPGEEAAEAADDDAAEAEPGEDGAGEEPGGEEAAEAIEGEAVEIERPRRRRPPPPPAKKRRVSIGWVVLIVVLFALAAGAFIYRADIVKAWPPAGKFYRTLGVGMPALELGLEINNVNYSQEPRNGVPTLLITGQIKNVGIDERDIPEMRVSLYDNKKRKLNHWTVPIAKSRLAPGESVPFSTKMADPPKSAKDFAVTFVLKR